MKILDFFASMTWNYERNFSKKKNVLKQLCLINKLKCMCTWKSFNPPSISTTFDSQVLILGSNFFHKLKRSKNFHITRNFRYNFLLLNVLCVDFFCKNYFLSIEIITSLTCCSAKDFIVNLIEINPRKRFSASEALSHQWIINELKPEVDISAQVKEKLKAFMAKTRSHTSELYYHCLQRNLQKALESIGKN